MKQLLRSVECIQPVCEPGDSSSRTSYFYTKKGYVIEADTDSQVIRVWSKTCGGIPTEIQFANTQHRKPLEPVPLPAMPKAKGAA